MKQLLCITIILLLAGWLLTGSPAVADIYKYVDDKGRIHYTNNPESIPKASRKDVVIDQEVETPTPTAAPTATQAPLAAPEKEDNGASADPEDPNTPLAQLRKEKEYLNNERQKALSEQWQALDTERQAIKTENDRLETVRQKVNTPEEMRRYNAAVEAYNQRADAYQKQKSLYLKEKEIFQKEVDAYRTKEKQFLKETLEGTNKNVPQPAPAQEAFP